MAETGKTDDKLEKELTMLAISLTTESLSRDPSRDLPLGMVSLQPSGITVCTLCQLRSHMGVQLPSLPVSFIFLTKHGWPLTKSQEKEVKIQDLMSPNHVVRIQRSYEKPRVGLQTTDGRSIGFVFFDHCGSVSALRHAISQQLGNISGLEGSQFQFLDSNSWPVSAQQENCLTVLDLLHDACVRISPSIFHPSVLAIEGAAESDCGCQTSHFTQIKNRFTHPELTFRTGKDQERVTSRQGSHETSGPKDILLSYVRAEAAKHALTLKDELSSRGFSVYLDVHEIKSGLDWQDSLNEAVSNCEVFIPLVTPRYGETQWTNREVKLADVLGKFIIPVTFLDHWPPKCLAIQFATTQYVPWKMENGGYVFDEESEEGVWSKQNVEFVANQIASHLKEHDLELSQRPASQLSKRMSVLRSCAASLPDEFAQLSQHREGRPLLVIGVHPQQSSLGESLQELFEAEGYEVWCSTELLNTDGDTCKLADSQELFQSQESTGSRLRQFSDDSDAESSLMSHDKRLKFQEKADEAGLIIFILSENFAQSRTSRQQVFYCEHRKRVIPVRCEEFCMPFWMSMLIGTGTVENSWDEGYEQLLLARVRRTLDPLAREDSNTKIVEDKIAGEVTELRQRLPKAVYVYISGGTRFYNKDKDSEEICRAIGQQLAAVEDVLIITGGFRGVGETVGRSCAESRSEHIWHILPSRDEQDRRVQSWQNADKTFSRVPYGRTLFSGSSVRERESIVARVCDICILVEGGPGAAHEAEEFTWNDHVVIPIMCTGGAAGGKFGVPDKVFRLPSGVSSEDWRTLGDHSATPTVISQSVAQIIIDLKERMKMDSPSFLGIDQPALCPGGSPRKSVSFSPRRSPRKRHSLSRDKTFIYKKNKEES